jgi:hypothetical protein
MYAAGAVCAISSRTPFGAFASRCFTTASCARFGYCPGTSRHVSFAVARDGMIVFDPSPW